MENYLKTMRLAFLGEIEVEVTILELDLAVTKESIEELQLKIAKETNTFVENDMIMYKLRHDLDALARYSEPIKRKEAEQSLLELKNDLETLKKLWKIHP